MAAKKLKIHPLDDRIVVEPVEAEERTSGGIVLPDSAQEKPQRGHVVAVGPGRLLESGKRASLLVALGDEVIYGVCAFRYCAIRSACWPENFCSSRHASAISSRACFVK